MPHKIIALGHVWNLQNPFTLAGLKATEVQENCCILFAQHVHILNLQINLYNNAINLNLSTEVITQKNKVVFF